MDKRKGLDGRARQIPDRPEAPRGSMATPAPTTQRPPTQTPPPPPPAHLSRERELMAEVKRLKIDLAKAQPVLDAAAAWHATQLHTPMSPKLKARTALILAIKDYKEA